MTSELLKENDQRYASHNLEINKKRGHLMKNQNLLLIYPLELSLLDLAMFTDIFEKETLKPIFSNLGVIVGLSISKHILITENKSFINLIINRFEKLGPSVKLMKWHVSW